MANTSGTQNQLVDASIGESREALPATIEHPGDLAALRKQWAGTRAIPVVVDERAHGQDRSWASLDVRTMLRGEHSAGRFAVHNIKLAPGAGLPPHYHDDVYTYLLVLAGSVELQVGHLVEEVGQHSLGFVPPMTRQAFRNVGNAEATLVMVTSPAGVERAFAAAHDRWLDSGEPDPAVYAGELAKHGIRFDDAPLANDGLTNTDLPPIDLEVTAEGDLARLRELFAARPALPRLVRTTPEEYDAARAGAHCRKQLLNGDHSGGQAMINLLSGLPGFGASPHFQPTEEEFFFVTGGLLELVCGTETVVLGAGAVAFCPRDCTHGFTNRTDTESRFVTMNSPAGHERAMAAVRRLKQKGATTEQVHALSTIGGFTFHTEQERPR